MTDAASLPTPPLRLAFGLQLADLYERDGLLRVDAAFVERLERADAALARRLAEGRAAPDSLAPLAQSELLLALAPLLEEFVAELFGIEEALDALRARHAALDPLFEVKRKFVQRKAVRFTPPEEAAAIDGPALRARLTTLFGGRFDEAAYVEHVSRWMAEGGKSGGVHAEALETARLYAAWAALTEDGRRFHRGDVVFATPQGVDPQALVPEARRATDAQGLAVYAVRPEDIRRRSGFGLTDPGGDLRYALDHARYCLLCHATGRDSCSKGLKHDQASAARGREAFRATPHGEIQTGCPLEERISEFHQLKQQAVPIGALAMICVDNPMAAATGHRICNDCVRACIFQKQTPVDIPQTETRTLKDVLELPWGFEIYSLLTRWNPLSLARPVPRAPTGKRVLVVGLGPAGFTLAHHLMNDGHSVVAIDGLKIEPLPPSLGGVTERGERVPFEPVHDFARLRVPLDERAAGGFGGVAEYGITVRWDKNFLTTVRLLLERRPRFLAVGGVRFGAGAAGGNLTEDDAFALGFDHVALAVGAGSPTVLQVSGGLARGVRAASDFLMALQLTGAARADSIANLQLRLPVVVVGGGLTAVDTATEALAYYPVQVEKFLRRHEVLVAAEAARLGASASLGARAKADAGAGASASASAGAGAGANAGADADSNVSTDALHRAERAVRASWTAEEAEIGDEFLAHARAIRDERAAAAREGRAARVLELLQAWGGSTIAYRRRFLDSPAYGLSPEELGRALEEGIRFAEGVEPVAVETDAQGAAFALRLRRRERDDAGRWRDAGDVTLPARSVFVAAGTQPNTVLAQEDPLRYRMDGRYFAAIDEAGEPVPVEAGVPKPHAVRVLMRRAGDARFEGRYTSFFGDVHPSFAGNVVRAMGSARSGHPLVTRVLAGQAPASALPDAAFFARVREELGATVFAVRRLAPTIVEVVVRAPSAARHFRPGQFYRLQNLERHAAVVAAPASRTVLAMEGLALTGAWVDVAQGLVGLIVLEMGGSSELCARLAPGEPVVLMGPTGAPTEIPSGQTVVLAGGGLGNAVLFSIGLAMRAAGCRVLYFAGYRRVQDRYRVADIEAAADAVVWCCDEAPGFAPGRPQDRSFVGNIVDAMRAYAQGGLGETPIRLADADRLIAIGSDRMMAAVAAARHGALAPHLDPSHVAIGSINSPMQCMMKQICAQCLQRQVDPATGRERIVFSCAEQDQPLDAVDWQCLDQRLRQNSLQEKQTAAWLRLVANEPLRG